MLTMTGKVIGVPERPKGTTKDGKEYGGYHQVEILTRETLKNGDESSQLHHLMTSEPESFKSLIGHSASFPVTAWAKAKNDIVYQLVEGENPVRVSAKKEAS